MSRLWSEITKNIEPYVPGEQPSSLEKCIKLNTNENPFPPSPKVMEAINKVLDDDRLRLYPDPECKELRDALSKVYNIDKKNIFVGNGSDEVLAMAFMAFFQGKNDVLIPEISYSFYPVYCNLFNVGYKPVPLREDFSIDISDYLKGGSGVIITNPNAPTSLALSRTDIEEIIKYDANRLVIVDEAYVDFGAESVIPLINKYDNLLVVQTLSKSRALAGLRVGFAFGNEELIIGLDKIKNSFNSYTIDCLAQKGATAAILDEEYYCETIKKIVDIRERTREKLVIMGFDVLESKTNFLFIEHKKVSAKYIFQELRKENIIVRYFDKPKIDNRLRVTIGTEEEMKTFISAIEKIINSKTGG